MKGQFRKVSHKKADGESSSRGVASRASEKAEASRAEPATGVGPQKEDNGAHVLLRRVEDSFARKAAYLAGEPGRFGASARRGLKFAVGLAVALGLGWSPLKTLLAPTSLEAVINARLVTIRSPIEGYVEETPSATAQWGGESAAPALVIVNSDADRAPLARARRDAADNDDRIEINAGEQRAVEMALLKLEAQVQQFRESRGAATRLRLAGLTDEADAAAAFAAQAEAHWTRARKLRASGVTAAAEEEKAAAQARAGALTARAAKAKAAQAEIESQALAKGAFFGDSYNDMPTSAQTALELRMRYSALQAQASALGRNKARLTAELETETADYARRSRASPALPASGRVFESLVMPGERVGKGQDLLRVLDCETAVVSANVEESVYNWLRMGGRASFQPADGGDAIAGEIVNLTGGSAAPGVYAISPASLRKSSFYVSVGLPRGEGACGVGRTGTVTFSKD